MRPSAKHSVGAKEKERETLNSSQSRQCESAATFVITNVTQETDGVCNVAQHSVIRDCLVGQAACHRERERGAALLNPPSSSYGYDVHFVLQHCSSWMRKLLSWFSVTPLS